MDPPVIVIPDETVDLVDELAQGFESCGIDVFHHNTMNSFSSLSPVDKQAVLDRFKDLVPARPAPSVSVSPAR